MYAKLLAIMAVLLFVSACSTTQSSPSKVVTEKIAQKHIDASQDVEPFTLVGGDQDSPVRASDRVFFAFDSAVLDSNAQSVLDRQVAWLKERAHVNLTIEGHCDERGTREYNLALGERRANAVRDYIVSSGVSSSRITVVSYGKERPAVLGNNAAAYAENRRGVTVPDNL